jgi:hypothetical protein
LGQDSFSLSEPGLFQELHDCLHSDWQYWFSYRTATGEDGRPFFVKISYLFRYRAGFRVRYPVDASVF